MVDEAGMLNKQYDGIELERQDTGSTQQGSGRSSLASVDETAMLNDECDGFERQVTTASLIQEYDGLKQQLTPFQDYEEEQVQAIDAQVASVLHQINLRQTLLNQTQKADTDMQKRVHRNENPRFFHYIVCNRAEKVERLKEELQQLNTTVQTLIDKLCLDSAKLSRLLRKQLEAHTIIDKKFEMEGQSRQLFNQVVDCQPATQTLRQLRTREQLEQSRLASEEKLLQGVSNSVQLVQQGLSLFQEAKYYYRQANCINERSKSVYADISDEAVGSDFGSETRSWISGLAEEKDLQWQHGKKSNQANGVAIQAFRVIRPGFESFPFEAIGRYPQLCRNLKGDAILWHAGSFRAAEEDIRYDILGCKIVGDLRLVGQCASMTSQQLKIMMAVQDAIAINVHQLQASLQNLEQKIIDERNNMFNGVRSAVMSAPVT